MQPTARRPVLIVGLLLLAVGLVWAQRTFLAPRLPDEVLPAQTGTPAAGEPGFVYFTDIEGWYRITPYETVLRSPYDLTADSTEEMSRRLSPTIGEWVQVGADRDSSQDPSVIEFLKHPTVALSRTYADPNGLLLSLSLVGNTGEDSFLLFSHTPETCYPGVLWDIVAQRRESAPIDDRSMSAQYLLTQHQETGERLMVLFFYVWENAERDSRAGVLSVRVNLYLPPDQSEEAILARAWDFIRALFPATIPWDRF